MRRIISLIIGLSMLLGGLSATAEEQEPELIQAPAETSVEVPPSSETEEAVSEEILSESVDEPTDDNFVAAASEEDPEVTDAIPEEQAEFAAMSASVSDIDESFDDLEDGALPTGWSAEITSGSTNSAGAATMDGEDGKVLKIDASQEKKKVLVQTPVFEPSEFTLSYRVKFETPDINAYLGLYVGDAQTIAMHESANMFRYRKGSATVGLAGVKANDWNNVTVYVDNDSRQVEIWINGTLSGKGNLFRNDTSGAADKLLLGVDNTSSSIIYIDDVKMEPGYTVNGGSKIKPSISVDGITNGETLENVSELNAEITATDDTGVVSMEIYHNDILVDSVSESNYSLALSDLDTGNHTLYIKATDTDGNVGQKTIKFTVSWLLQNPLYTEDFSGYSVTAGNTSLTSGITAYSQRGYVKAHKVDDEHGTSMAIGIDTVNPGFNSGDRPYANLVVQDVAGAVTVEFDVYIEKSAQEASPFQISFKQQGGTDCFVASFVDGQFRVGSTAVECMEQTWYTCVLKIDVTKHTFDVQFYPAGGEPKTVAAASAFSTDIDLLWSVRLWGPGEDLVSTFMAVDNVSVVKRSDLPEVTEIGSNGEKNGFTVDNAAEDVEIYMSEPVRASSLKKDSITIKEGSGRSVPIKDITVSKETGAITVTLGKKLKSDTEYEAEISKDVILDNLDMKIGRSIKGNFKTTPGEIEFVSCGFNNTGGSVSVNCSIKNNTWEERSAELFISVWNKEKFVKMQHKTVSVGAGITVNEVIDGVVLSDGETAEVYLWDCTGAWPVMLTNKIYSYTN